jgi:hypothetical protein
MSVETRHVKPVGLKQFKHIKHITPLVCIFETRKHSATEFLKQVKLSSFVIVILIQMFYMHKYNVRYRVGCPRPTYTY